MCYVMDVVMTNLRQYDCNSGKIITNEDILIPFEGIERKPFAVENIVDKTTYLTI